MSNLFSTVPITRIARSRHNLSHQVKASFNAGTLTPLLCELASPGSTWFCPNLEEFIRSMPMIAPVMDRMDVKVDAFFTPLRLIWDDFEDYITLGPTGEFNVDKPTLQFAAAPNIPAESYAEILKVFGTGGLADYLNFPTLAPAQLPVAGLIQTGIDALPFRTYQLLYNEYYRNENLEDEIPIDRSSGSLTLSLNSGTETDFTNFMLRYRGWRKDYFTSALPSPQKGPAVRMPGGSSDLTIVGTEPMQFAQYGNVADAPDSFSQKAYNSTLKNAANDIVGRETVTQDTTKTKSNAGSAYIYSSGLGIESEGSASAATIEELRYAETLQEFYEANARGGSRYKEYLMNIWHTKSKDSRLDRPERIGGFRGPVTISDVDQTSESNISPQATPAGKGLSSGSSRLFKYKTSEWGIFMVILSLQPKTSYFQGFRRWNLYNDVFDWPNPFFANLGEQEIINKEIYFDPIDSDGKNDDTFGYTPRFAEAKFIPDSVHGEFRTSLDYWHLARKFSSRPNLNKAFVHVDPAEIDRIFPSQVEDDQKFIGTFYFHLWVKMHLPYYGVPRLIHSI